MKTRSQTQKEEITRQSHLMEVFIDFDEASKCWLKNKKSLGNGTYKYICANTNCEMGRHKNTEFCWKHRGSIK